MKKLIITALIAIASFTVQAQTKSKLVADETELVQLKTSFKVVTSNETIFSLLLKEFNVEVTKYTVEYKKDRQGRYKSYSVPFKPELLERLNQFFNKLNK